jgi:predicted dehydrogenase
MQRRPPKRLLLPVANGAQGESFAETAKDSGAEFPAVGVRIRAMFGQTRRAFGMGTAFLIAAGIFCSCCAGAFGRPQNEEPVRVAIVGLEHGHVAGFLNAFPKQQDTQLVGIVDADQALCAKYERQYHLSPSMFYATLDDLLAHQHPQALLVYTAVGEHRRVIEAGAAHGLDVMVEKPLTLSLDDALAIRRAADEHHVQVLVNYETTWYASNRAVYDMIQQGRLGEVRRVVIHDGHQGPIEIHVQPEFLKWLTDPAENGAGALYDFGCYGADLMTWLMHGEAPISVTAVSQTDKPDEYPHVDDDATIILRYPKTQAVLMPSWNWTFSRKDMEVSQRYGSLWNKGVRDCGEPDGRAAAVQRIIA